MQVNGVVIHFCLNYLCVFYFSLNIQMGKRIKKLEKEGAQWKAKWESSNKALIDMAEEVSSTVFVTYLTTLLYFAKFLTIS